MSITPVPKDANGNALANIGSEAICDVRTLATDWVPIQFPVDIKGLSISIDAGTVYFDGVANGSKAWFDAAAVTDNGDGTITIAAADHGFTDGDDITIYGTTNYNETVTVLAAGDADNLVVTPTPHVATLDDVAAVDNGDGTVTLAAAAHGFTVGGGDTVTIAGTTNYDGAEVLAAATDADNLVITAGYVAEVISTATATGLVQEVIPATTAYALGRRYPSRTSTSSPFVFDVAVPADTTVVSMKSDGGGAIVSMIAKR